MQTAANAFPATTDARTGQRAWWTATLLSLGAIAAWDASGADMAVLGWFGTPQGFAARDAFVWSVLGHDALRQLATLAWVLLWLAVLWPVGALRHFGRGERLSMAVGATVALVVVGFIKRHSATSCPWDLAAFGGAAQWVSHWNWWTGADGGPGHCFPGGHASGALAFLAMAWPGLSDPRACARGRAGRRLLALCLLAGAVFGVVQTVRGAHPPSHTAWTAWLCWTSTALTHALHRWAAPRFTAFPGARATVPPPTPPRPAAD